MICPRCQSLAPEGAKFCSACGTPLALSCSHCASLLPPGARFCHNCGQPVDEATGEAPIAPASAHLAPEVAAKLASSAARSTSPAGPRGGIEAERRIVTVLFCDVKGSTALAESLDPEEWTEIMNGAFERLIEPVTRYGGTLARLMGDAILAFFGAPVAHEDDPQRAVLAGLAIVEGIESYRDDLRRHRGFTFDVRVGINTGLVVVGDVGSSQRVEYTAMGDAVNLAARMEQTAALGTVRVTAATRASIISLFDWESLGGVDVKGKAAPVQAYRPVAARRQLASRGATAGRIVGLVGRDAEIARLREIVAAVRNGQGQIVSVIGEAGIGKSRLIREMHQAWTVGQLETPDEAEDSDRSPRWSVSRGISYEAMRPYGLWRQQLTHLLNLRQLDSAAARDRISLAFADTGPERPASLVSAAEIILGRPLPDGQTRREGESLKREIVAATLAIVRDWIEGGPGVLVFDDLHWADPASVDLLCEVAALTRTIPLLVVCAFRPDRDVPAWSTWRQAAETPPNRYVELDLAPLSAEQTTTLITRLVGSDSVPATVREAAIGKADGNPFFVEEIVRAVLDPGIVADTSGIPSTVQALLVARVDRLPDDARQTIQTAAVIGRSFPYRLLRAMVGRPAEVDRHLGLLVEADLIRETVNGDDRMFAFRHALTRDATYESILRRRRREIHRQVGDSIETSATDHVVEVAPILAHHFAAADDHRAGYYHALAADHAYRLYANAEAAVHYAGALSQARRGPAQLADLAGRLRRSEADLLTYLSLQRGRALELIGRPIEAVQSYRELEAVAIERHDLATELKAVLARATVYATPNPAYNPALGRELLDRALQIAEALNDREAEARILWNLLLLHTFTFELPRAIDYGLRSLAIARDLDQSEQVAFTLNDLHRAYMFSGQIDQAVLALAEAHALWLRLDNLPMLGDNLASQAYVDYLNGDDDKALAVADEAARLCTTIGNEWGLAFSQLAVGPIQLERGNLDAAIASMEEAILRGDRSGHPPVRVVVRAALAWTHGLLGDVERGIEIAREGIRAAEYTFPILQPWPRAVLARLLLQTGDLAAAEAAANECYAALRLAGSMLAPIWTFLAVGEVALAAGDPGRTIRAMDELLDYARDFQTHPFVADGMALKARALRSLGRRDDAYALLGAAVAKADARGARSAVWPILLSLAEIEKERGNLAAATQHRKRATAIVRVIANRLSDPRQRAGFLATPAVKAALAPRTSRRLGLSRNFLWSE